MFHALSVYWNLICRQFGKPYFVWVLSKISEKRSVGRKSHFYIFASIISHIASLKMSFSEQGTYCVDKPKREVKIQKSIQMRLATKCLEQAGATVTKLHNSSCQKQDFWSLVFIYNGIKTSKNEFHKF